MSHEQPALRTVRTAFPQVELLIYDLCARQGCRGSQMSMVVYIRADSLTALLQEYAAQDQLEYSFANSFHCWDISRLISRTRLSKSLICHHIHGHMVFKDIRSVIWICVTVFQSIP